VTRQLDSVNAESGNEADANGKRAMRKGCTFPLVLLFTQVMQEKLFDNAKRTACPNPGY